MVDTGRVNRAMRDATDQVCLDPDFTDRVVRGGRRRVRRARVRTAALAVAVLAAGGGATVAWRDAAGTVVVADYRLVASTAGDLAGDAGLIERAVSAWRVGLRHSENGDGAVAALRGEPHVYWAGTTTAGPAAVVVQEGARRGQVGLSGLVATDPVSKAFRLVGEELATEGAPWVYAFGPEDRTLLTVDRGVPLFISMAPVTAPDGRVAREWRRMALADGVALAQVPAGGDPDDVRVFEREGPPGPRERDHAGLRWARAASEYVAQTDERRDRGSVTVFPSDAGLPWQNPTGGGPVRVGRPTRVTDDGGILLRAVTESDYLDPLIGTHGTGRWEVVAGLPDGRTALLSEVYQESDPPLLFAVLVGAAGGVEMVIPAGAADRYPLAPVVVRLPDGQGWLVAAYGSALAYRTGAAGAWVEAGRDAALLPEAATWVRVTGAGGGTASRAL